MSRVFPWRRQALLAFTLVLAGLAGCVVVPARGRYVTGGVVVGPPAPAYVGIGGYWGWHGGRRVWVRGR